MGPEGKEQLEGIQVLPTTTKDVHDLYHFHDLIGKGTFGSVWECEDKKTGVKFACKSIPKKFRNMREVTEVRNEVSAMKRLSGHPNVIFLVDAFEDKEYVYMVMEYCPGGELFDWIQKVGKFPEPKAALIFYEAAQAVHHCHFNRVIHRDLKPENFFLVPVEEPHGPEDGTCEAESAPSKPKLEYKIKLGDFGLSLHLPEGVTIHGASGSKLYEPPEQLSGKEYDFKADMWSLGVVLYVLLSGELPFFGKTKLDIVEEIMDNGVRFTSDAWSNVSDGPKDLIKRLLEVDLRHRATSVDVLDDPWLAAHCTKVEYSFTPAYLPSDYNTEEVPEEKSHHDGDDCGSRSHRRDSSHLHEFSLREKFMSFSGRFTHWAHHHHQDHPDSNHNSKGLLGNFRNCIHPRVQSSENLMNLDKSFKG